MKIFDAQAATAFVMSQTTHIEAGVNEIVHPDIQYSFLTPVDTSANPFAQTVTYFSSEKFGKAGWINGNADDIPIAGTELNMFKTAVYTAAIGYGFGWEEVNVAMLIGRNLQSDDAAAARRAYEEMVDRVALQGDASKSFSGLLDYPGITVQALPNGDWDGSSATEDGMLEDINSLILGVASGTAYTSIANTLLLPLDKLNKLATTRLGDTTSTILEFLRKNNTYTAITGQPLAIRGVRGLETAGVGSATRMIAYRRSDQVLKMHIPMPHRFLPVFQDGPLHWLVPGVFRLGGLDIRRPAEVRYGDGI